MDISAERTLWYTLLVISSVISVRVMTRMEKRIDIGIFMSVKEVILVFYGWVADINWINRLKKYPIFMHQSYKLKYIC